MKCPYEIKPRAGFRGIYGGSDPKQEAEDESCYSWSIGGSWEYVDNE